MYRWGKFSATIISFFLASMCCYLVQPVGSDYQIHGDLALALSWSDASTWIALLKWSTTPLWHTVVKLLSTLGLGRMMSIAATTGVFKAVEVWLLIGFSAYLLKKKSWTAVCVGFIAAIVSAVWVPLLNEGIYGIYTGSPNPWHNPTYLAVAPFVVGCVWLIVRIYSGFFNAMRVNKSSLYSISGNNVVITSVVLAISPLAKPSFLQAFLPALCLFNAGLWFLYPRQRLFLIRMTFMLIPSMFIIALQFVLVWVAPTAGSSLQFMVTWHQIMGVLFSIVFMRLFPLYTLIFCTSSTQRKSPLLLLILLYDAIALLEMLMLAESGARFYHGNMNWAMMASGLMLWIIALNYFAQNFADKRATHVYRIGFVLLGWHITSGICYYSLLLLTPRWY